MKSKIFSSVMMVLVVPVQNGTAIGNGMWSYLLGVFIALFIMGYLVYSLLKPEKF